MYKNRYFLKEAARCPAICLLLSLYFSATGFAQENEVAYLKHHFSRYGSMALQEKVFVHTDRSFYMAGETMWFKVYAVEGSSHMPLDISKVAYLEVLDKDQKPVLQTKVALQIGSGSGSLYLPVSLQSGNFSLRAYTRWMKNFPADFYFEKKLKLVNSFIKPERVQQQETSATPELKFFPEGGALVIGIRSRLAFKAANTAGKGINFEGVVLDQHQDTIASFKPFKFGMGSFYFTPEAGKTYKALIKYDHGAPFTYPLPQAEAQGYVMHVEDSLEKKGIRLTVQSNLQTTGSVYLLIHTRQQLKIVRAAMLQNGKAEFLFDKNQLGEGISHLTVFNQTKQAVSERLYFKQARQLLQVKAESDKETYGLREKVEIDIAACHETGKPALADLSVAVYQLDSLSANDDHHNSLFSYLWLSSDLKGKVEEPEYEGQILEARVINKESQAPAAGVTGYLSILGENGQFYNGVSNEEGELRFIAKDFYGQKDLVLQASPQDNKQLDFHLYSPYSKQYTSSSLAPFSLSPRLAEKLRARSVHLQVENVYTEKEKIKTTEPATAKRAFYGIPSKRYLLDDYTRFPTMEEVMREYVNEVMVRNKNGRFHFSIYDPFKKQHFDQNLLVLLNGLPVFDLDRLMAFNPLKVESLEIVNETFFQAGIPYRSILNYTTFQGKMDGFELDPDVLQLSFEGLQLSREFYVPQHTSEYDMERRMPDFRSLLYWSPDVHTSEEGKKKIHFYTSDLAGTYQVEIQGITKEGKAANTSFIFKTAE